MYRVVLNVDGTESTQSLKVEIDPTLSSAILAEEEERAARDADDPEKAERRAAKNGTLKDDD
jgi:hypothetical protein